MFSIGCCACNPILWRINNKVHYTRYTSKRKRRVKSACEFDSDDPYHSDYTDGLDSGVGDVTVSPRPVKRRRRTAATKTQPARALRDSPYSIFSSQTPEEAFATKRNSSHLSTSSRKLSLSTCLDSGRSATVQRRKRDWMKRKISGTGET